MNAKQLSGDLLVSFLNDMYYMDFPEMIAAQLSERTGELLCIDENERVIVAGNAVTFSKGIFYL
jgi:hypothetical protein